MFDLSPVPINLHVLDSHPKTTPPLVSPTETKASRPHAIATKVLLQGNPQEVVFPKNRGAFPIDANE